MSSKSWVAPSSHNPNPSSNHTYHILILIRSSQKIKNGVERDSHPKHSVKEWIECGIWESSASCGLKIPRIFKRSCPALPDPPKQPSLMAPELRSKTSGNPHPNTEKSIRYWIYVAQKDGLLSTKTAPERAPFLSITQNSYNRVLPRLQMPAQKIRGQRSHWVTSTGL